MGDLSAWLEDFRSTIAEALRSLAGYLPYLFAALMLLVIGWIVARILRALFIRLGSGLNRLLERINQPAGMRRLRLSQPVLTLIGNVIFWVVILIFAAMAARIGRLDAFTSWLDRIVAYLPTLVAGGLIALAGYLVSTLIRDVVTTTVASTGSNQAELFGFATQSAVFLTAVVIGLDQIGIDVTFLITLLGIVVGGLLLGIVFAFGFGARAFVGNLIASQQIQRLLEPGTVVEVGGQQGQVLEINATTVVLITERGRLIVPAKVFQEQTTLIVADYENE
jgi:Conserved TM helix